MSHSAPDHVKPLERDTLTPDTETTDLKHQITTYREMQLMMLGYWKRLPTNQVGYSYPPRFNEINNMDDTGPVNPTFDADHPGRTLSQERVPRALKSAVLNTIRTPHPLHVSVLISVSLAHFFLMLFL